MTRGREHETTPAAPADAQCQGCPDVSRRPVPQDGHLSDCTECARHCQCRRRAARTEGGTDQ